MLNTPPQKTQKKGSEFLPKITNFFTLQEMCEELVYGSLAGLAICLGGHPFDTIKTRMQMEHKSLLKTTTSILKREGPQAFYKGIGGPLASVPLLNAIVFSSYEISKRIFEHEGKIGYYYIGLSGAIAGFIQCVVVNPTELVKCKMQMQKGLLNGKNYANSWECAKDILKKDGIRGINQGMFATIVREVPAYVVQFTVYEFVKKEIFGKNAIFGKKVQYSEFNEFNEELNIIKKEGEKSSSSELGGWRTMAAGAIAGVTCWAVSFPPDVVKTRIQCAERYSFKSKFFDGGFYTVARDVAKSQGVKGFFNGFNAIVGRAVIANALGFWVWEISREMIQFQI